jgi:phthiocerol/phenolphthiocerol synthesis type-I polyketide synthase E
MSLTNPTAIGGDGCLTASTAGTQPANSTQATQNPAQLLTTQLLTTQMLTRIWQELLGVDTIAADQNYFDLGGDSSLAVQLFARIEKEFGVKLPLATLFEAPTIEEQARVLEVQRAVNATPAIASKVMTISNVAESSATPASPVTAEAPAARSGWSPLVTIQSPNPGQDTRPAFFCMHGAGGNVLIYRDLAKNLGADQPFYGLQAQGLDGTSAPLTTIEAMAELYAKEIRRAQAHGPYYIGGYCMGGTLAYEVARQLKSEGEEIALLALFDTMDWSKVKLPGPVGQLYHQSERIVFHVANFFRLDGHGKRRFFSEKVEALRNRLPVWRGMLMAEFGSGAAQERVLGAIWQANDKACLAYAPQPLAGELTDFRPMKQYRMFDLPGGKWDQLALGGARVVELPVYPAGMLVEPFVKHLATALRTAIDDATAKQRANF